MDFKKGPFTMAARAVRDELPGLLREGGQVARVGAAVRRDRRACGEAAGPDLVRPGCIGIQLHRTGTGTGPGPGTGAGTGTQR